jgi:hypothetical protein
VRQRECEGDERNLNVVLQQGVDSERCGDCLEPRDQRELQREDRQSREAERNREFNEERTAWRRALADRQQERRQAEQQVEEHPDKPLKVFLIASSRPRRGQARPRTC